MDRRQLLALCGAGLAGLAGCNSDRRTDQTPLPDEPDDRSTSTDSPSPTATSADASEPTEHTPSTATSPDTELAVKLDALQPAVVEIDVDYLRLRSGGQFLYLDVSVTAGQPPSVTDLAFRFDGTDFAPVPIAEVSLYRTLVGNGQYEAANDSGAGWVLFQLPETGDASDAGLVWPGGEWRPEEQLRNRLAAPLPRLSLEAWNVPETVALNSTPTFGFTVRNEGGYPGRFVGGINESGWGAHRPIRRVSRRIPPGETRSWAVPGRAVDPFIEEAVGDGEPDIEYELISTGGHDQQAVRVVEESQSTEG